MTNFNKSTDEGANATYVNQLLEEFRESITNNWNPADNLGSQVNTSTAVILLTSAILASYDNIGIEFAISKLRGLIEETKKLEKENSHQQLELPL